VSWLIVGNDKLKILIVDDDEQILRFVSRALAENDIESDTASNGREAIESLTDGDYAVVLLDVLMPEVDGIQVLMELKKSAPEKMPVVIAMSGGGQSLPGWYAGHLVEMMGAQSVLYKPFSVDELLRRIATAEETS
jgi:two-component system response regulator ResD